MFRYSTSLRPPTVSGNTFAANRAAIGVPKMRLSSRTSALSVGSSGGQCC
jgi:hypothetical protein